MWHRKKGYTVAAETPKDDTELLAQIKKRFQAEQSYYSEEYERGREDMDFVDAGEQWPENIREARRREGRPCLTENRTKPFVNQLVNNVRQSQLSINVRPVDSAADIETAKIFSGLIKNIEVCSDASSVYATGAACAIKAGYGYWRITTDYASDDGFDKEAKLIRIPNPFSVYLDSNAQRADGLDAEYGFIFDNMPCDEFKRAYPDASEISFNEIQNEWTNGETITVAEYFYKTYDKKTIVQTADGKIYTKGEEPAGSEIVNKRTIEIPSVKWCKTNGVEILEKTDWEGSYIPIVRVFGDEVYVEQKRKSYSLIHPAKDPQMMYNFWKTANTEVIALQPKAPYIGAVGQFKTMRNQWMMANTQNVPFLEYDPIDANGQPQPAPQRQTPPVSSPAMAQEVMMAAEGIKASLGIYDASLGASSNEKSGRAILARQQQGDNATFHFIDNVARAIRATGTILVDLLPKITRVGQMMRVLQDDQDQKVITAANFTDPAQGFYALGAGKYDVIVDVGPSYASKRQQAVESILEIAKIDPRILQIAPDILFKNLDIPNAQEIAERVKKIMDPALLSEENPMVAQLEQAAQAVQQLQAQLVEMDAALKTKQDNQAFENQYKMEELALKKAELEIKAAETQAKIAQMQAQTGQVSVEVMAEVLSAIDELDKRVTDAGEALDLLITKEEQDELEDMDETSMPEGDTQPPKGVA